MGNELEKVSVSLELPKTLIDRLLVIVSDGGAGDTLDELIAGMLEDYLVIWGKDTPVK